MNGKRGTKLKLAVLASGEGTGLDGLIRCAADGRLADAWIALVIVSRADCGALHKARAAGIALKVIQPRDCSDDDGFSAAIFEQLERHGVDLAVQAGWMPYWRLTDDWIGRVINVHPSLLPKFGGRGFYGRRVHQAVLASGDTETGATVHWVDNEYDHGPIITQLKCPVLPTDDVEALERRVKALEPLLLADAIRHIAQQRITSSGFAAVTR